MIDESYEALRERLQKRLQRPLPAVPAQRAGAAELSYGRHYGPAAYNARPAAVLIIFCQVDGQWRIPLTLRPSHMSAHAGQISLPGGMTEAGESPEQCALREVGEELGIGSDLLELLGFLTPLYVFNSNFHVTPCLALCRSRPRYRPNPAEVQQVVELPASCLLEDRRGQGIEICSRGVRFRAPCIEHRGHRIWGATCMILSELAKILRESYDCLSG